MWSTESDRARAEREVRAAAEYMRTPSMLVEDRILRWREEEPGEETEGVIDLLCDAEEELRRLRADRPPAE